MQINTINVDGTEYRVQIIYPTLTNEFSIIEGPNSGTAQTGREIRDIIGTKYNYALNIEPDKRYPEDFDALFEALSAPVESHRITMPYSQGTISFDAAISDGNRTWYGRKAGYQRWGNMQIRFRALKPQRMSEE